jgi:hypothetical protein
MCGVFYLNYCHVLHASGWQYRSSSKGGKAAVVERQELYKEEAVVDAIWSLEG